MGIVDEVIHFERRTVINKGTNQSKPMIELKDVRTAVVPWEKVDHALLDIEDDLFTKSNFLMIFSLCEDDRYPFGG